jgi:hypothetical protein
MRTAGMVVLLLQSCPTPVAISCRPTRTEGPLRNGLVPGDDATARSDVAFHLVADCKHSVRSVRQYPS